MKPIRKLLFYIIIGVFLWLYFSGKSGETPVVTPPQITENNDVEIPPAREMLSTKKGSVDYIFVDKSARFMELYADGQLVKRYEIALGFAPVGQKTMQGDGKTPTGEYVIDWRNDQSQFYRSLHISYPRPDQVEQAKLDGRDPGGDIMIHGQINGREWQGDRKIEEDWTLGCISVSNNEMDEIWGLVRNGAKIKIVE